MKSTARYMLLLAALLFGALAALTPRASAQGGVPLWTNRYGAGTDNSFANAAAVAGKGTIFVTGSSHDPYDDFATVAYSNEGISLWTNHYNGAWDSVDQAYAIAAGKSGDVFVTGQSDGGDSFYDYATIAYSSAGVPLWTNFYNGPGNFEDGAYAIAVGSNGTVFVTGGSDDDDDTSDCATIAYSSAGVPLWTNRYSDGRGTAVAVDGGGNVFVTGFSQSNHFTVAYSGAGAPLWTNRHCGPGIDTQSGIFYYYALRTVIAADSSGHVFVTGGSGVSGSYDDYATIAYSSAGVPLWTNRYHGPANGYDYATAIALDSSGNVFVTGLSVGSNYDYATVAYSGAGVPLWTNRYNGSGDRDDKAFAIGVDASGNVIVTGDSVGSDVDYATVAYSGAGVPLWTNRYNGSGNRADYAKAIVVDASGNVFVTGHSWNGSNDDYVTIKYSSSIPPVYLSFQKADNQLVLSWTNVGFSLQTALASTGTFTNLPDATSPYTNPITGAQQFFRLKKN